MQALVYDVKPLGYVTCLWLRKLWKGCLLTGLNGLSLRTVTTPEVPCPDWVRVRTRLGGICGTDLAILAQHQPPDSILQAFSSMPMILGHENVGVVEAAGPAVGASWVGRRVCVEPTLCCAVRGIIEPCDRCKAGEFGACENFGDMGTGSAGIPPGTSIGYNNKTGGSFGELFAAHVSQLVAVPDDLSDEQAVLTDPLACSVHAVLRADLSQARRVLVYGAGVLGLGVITALRATGFAGRIDALDRSGYLKDMVANYGADELLMLPADRQGRFERIAERTGASVQRARLGAWMLSGGYDVVFDCVGTSQATDESLKWTRARGQVVMVATGHGRGVDLTPVWFRELTVIGSYGRQIERFGGRRIGTYQLVHELMRAGKLRTDGMLTHTFPLCEYKKALRTAMEKSAHRAVKVAIDFR